MGRVGILYSTLVYHGLPALSCVDVLCVHPLSLGGTKVNLLVRIQDDPE